MKLSVPQAQAAIIELLAARKPVPADLVAVILGDPTKGVLIQGGRLALRKEAPDAHR